MFFLISIWGSGRREYSAMKFLIFTFLGSAFMLVGILILFFSTGTFDMIELPDAIRGAKLLAPAWLVFTFIFVAFAVKLPVWPVHTWLPDAHTDAPTAVSIMLAGVLLKMGGYGMLRISAAMFPDVMVDAAKFLIVLGVVNVIYGAIVTLRQTDMKRLVAFSSISHMGYVLVGISSVAGVAGAVSPLGLTGAAMQMFTHGTITGLMFLMVGLAYEKAHTRHIPDLGGLATRMPVIAVGFLIAGLASLGTAGHERVRLRDTDLPGDLPRMGLVDGRRCLRSRHHGGLHPLDAPADDVRASTPALLGRARRDEDGDGAHCRPRPGRPGRRHLSGIHLRLL